MTGARPPAAWPLRAARRARAAMARRPAFPPPFAGQTLGRREERLAADALGQEPASWRDEETVGRFERRFAHWSGGGHAVSFLGGRVALSAAIAALGLRPGDEAVVPAYTCVVVPNAFAFAGIRVRYADIELDSYGLDAGALRKAVTPRTKAVLLHHLYGLVARDAAACAEIARDAGLAVLEDCAQASGATQDGRPVGHAADVAFHSFEKTKVLTTVAGGMATTPRPDLAERLREAQAAAPWPDPAVTRELLRNVALLRAAARGRPAPQGVQRWRSTTAEEEAGRRPPGYGARLPGPLAALGMAQLDAVDRHNRRRRRNAARWRRVAEREGWTAPEPVPGSQPVHLRYPVLVPAAMKADLSWGRRLGIQPGRWFLGTRHPVPGVVPGCPNAAEAVARCVNLPTLW